MRVLLVEDDPAVREGMTEVLEEVAPVELCTSADAAIARLSVPGLGLVVTDLHIGRSKSDGVRVISEAKKLALPVIVCTGYTGSEVREALGQVTADAIL